MAYQENKYYSITSVEKEAIVVSEALLESYSITNACLESLGSKLSEKLEFGFFSPGETIIEQGETGKDLYLLCNRQVDVFVNGQKILELPSPALLGDKGLIDQQSIRMATIRVSEGESALVIKIPMASFLRSYKEASIPDPEFKTETNVYYHLFQEIQHRLFTYCSLQKQLWDEVTTTLGSLNIQFVQNILERNKDIEWDNRIWVMIRKYFLSFHRFSWPENIPLNLVTLRKQLLIFADQTIKSKFSGVPQDTLVVQRQILWKKWLQRLSIAIVKNLPKEQLPINVGEVELFNPRIYQMSIQALVNSIEKKFIFKTAHLKETAKNLENLKVSNFFGKEVDSNEFNLRKYLDLFEELFELKHPNRIQAQIAQQTGHIAAKCENGFNESVSKMRMFLEKAQKIAASKNDTSKNGEQSHEMYKKNVAVLLSGFNAYNRKQVGFSHGYVGECRFDYGTTPNMIDLIRASSMDQTRKMMSKAFEDILEYVIPSIKELGTQVTTQSLFLCESFADYLVPNHELSTHYWIPISEGITLLKNDKEFGVLKPGTLIGGESWKQQEGGESWSLKLPDKRRALSRSANFLLMAIPKKTLPWGKGTDSLSEIDFEKDILPILQWLIDQNLNHLAKRTDECNQIFTRCSQIVELVRVEKRLKEFEEDKRPLADKQYQTIREVVFHTLGVQMEEKITISYEQLSKKIYNIILKQTKRDYPKLTIEEKSNKTYTLWRYVLSEVVSATQESEENKKVLPVEPPKSHFPEAQKDIEEILARQRLKSESFVNLLVTPPKVDLKKYAELTEELSVEEKTEIAISILLRLEQEVVLIIEDAHHFESRLNEIRKMKTDFDIKALKSEYIMESIHKLQVLLEKGSGE